MTENGILESTRKYTLWAVLGSAALLLVMSVLDVWGASPTEGLDDEWGLGDYEVTAEWWSRIEGTLALVLFLGGGVLLALLVASRVKRDDAAGKPASAAAAATATAKAAAPKAPAKAPAKKPAAKKAPATKAAPKMK